MLAIDRAPSGGCLTLRKGGGGGGGSKRDSEVLSKKAKKETWMGYTDRKELG